MVIMLLPSVCVYDINQNTSTLVPIVLLITSNYINTELNTRYPSCNPHSKFPCRCSLVPILFTKKMVNFYQFHRGKEDEEEE